MGITYFKRFRMEYDLTAPLFGPVNTLEGYRLYSWTESLLEAHANAKYRSFRTEIDANVFPCLGDREGCQRLMGEISRRKGFIPDATWLLVWQPSEKDKPDFCGTVQGIEDRKSVGSIQNLGIAPEHRGTGLGTQLLRQALQGFVRAGMAKATLEVTVQNTGALRLYHRLGFRTIKTVYKAVDVEYV
jgi:ribosomal protein S18 acetylase RimI-like enzyme